MKRHLIFAAALAAPFVGGGVAAADILPTQETTCVESEQVSVTSWTNPFAFSATVTLNGSSFTVPPFSTVERTDPWTGTTVNYTVTFAGIEGYTQTGTLETPTLYDGCGIPATTTTFVPPTTSTLVDLPPVTTTVEPAHAATPIIDRSVVITPPPAQEAPVELAFTGSGTELLILAGGLLIGSGTTLVFISKRARQS
jgi:hypothetical protein